MTAFEMRPASVETNKPHSTYITQQSLEGKGTLCHLLSPAQQRRANHFLQRCWSATESSNVSNLLAEFSSFFKTMHPSGLLP